MRGLLFFNFICKHFKHVLFREYSAILDLKDCQRRRDFKYGFMDDGFVLFVHVNYLKKKNF